MKAQVEPQAAAPTTSAGHEIPGMQTSVSARPHASTRAISRMTNTRTAQVGTSQRARSTQVLQRTLGNTSICRMFDGAVQTTLTVNTPGDAYEREADRVADAFTPARDEANDDEQRRDVFHPNGSRVMRVATASPPPSTDDVVPEDLQRRIASPTTGQPVPGKLRRQVERHLGADLSDVRVHDRDQDRTDADRLQAKAFTHGQDIWLGSHQSAHDERLMAHELTHVVQQRETNGSTVQGKPAVVQRFSGTEHEKLGDAAATNVDLGNGVVLSWGQIVALAGDHYATLEDLQRDTTTPQGRERIRAALEHYGSPGAATTTLPAPGAQAKEEMLGSYASLALQNIPHFVAGGTARESWTANHVRAIDHGIRAGLTNDTRAREFAYALEAFGQHFLTDAFAAGHLRTPRKEINDWYVSTFAPMVFDTFVNTLRQRVVDGIYAQVAAQSRAARIFEGRARERIRNGVNTRLNAAITAAGGRDVIITWFGRLVGGAVSGAIHDIEGNRGVQVSSQAHPTAWRAVGDARLERPTSPDEAAGAAITEAEARKAVLAGKKDVDDAFGIGRRESTNRDLSSDPTVLANTVHFGFNSVAVPAAASTSLRQTAAYLIYHPEVAVALVGHTDPLGPDDYNLDLGDRRAHSVSADLADRGVASAQISTSSEGESRLVTTNSRQFWRNRRVEFTYESKIVTTGHDVAYERAKEAARLEIGPQYTAERHLPTPVAGANPALPDWHWGSMPPDLRAEISRYVTAQVRPMVAGVLARPQLDPFVEDDNTIEPRPIAQAIINDLMADPVRFLEGAFGRAAGPP